MALVKCNECGKEMSDKAKICPKCGCPNYENVDIMFNRFNCRNSIFLYRFCLPCFCNRFNIINYWIYESNKFKKQKVCNNRYNL